MASIIILILRSLILPIFFVSVLSFYFGLMGVYIALPFSEIVTFFIASYFYKKYSKFK